MDDTSTLLMPQKCLEFMVAVQRWRMRGYARGAISGRCAGHREGDGIKWALGDGKRRGR